MPVNNYAVEDIIKRSGKKNEDSQAYSDNKFIVNKPTIIENTYVVNGNSDYSGN